MAKKAIKVRTGISSGRKVTTGGGKTPVPTKTSTAQRTRTAPGKTSNETVSSGRKQRT